MAYIGREPTYGAFEKQTLTADSSTTTFTLDYVVGSSSSILVSVAGVLQEPIIAYGLANGGQSIVFSEAPTTGDTVFLVFLGVTMETLTVGAGVITSQNALTAGATADNLLIYDDSATALKKISLSTLSQFFSIDWESKSASFTAAAGKAYFCDTSGGAIDVTLPSPTIGDTIRFLDVSGTFDTNDLTILYGSSKIQGASANLDVATERAGFTLIYYNATQGWILTEK